MDTEDQGKTWSEIDEEERKDIVLNRVAVLSNIIAGIKPHADEIRARGLLGLEGMIQMPAGAFMHIEEQLVEVFALLMNSFDIQTEDLEQEVERIKPAKKADDAEEPKAEKDADDCMCPSCRLRRNEITQDEYNIQSVNDPRTRVVEAVKEMLGIPDDAQVVVVPIPKEKKTLH